MLLLQNESDSLTVPIRYVWRGKCDCLPGRDGRDGRDGIQGVEGPSGAPGLVGPPGPSGKDRGGLTYIRWGKRSCPSTSGTTLVYEGLTAGSLYTHTGGGANYIYLTKEPLYQPGIETETFCDSVIFGTEYQTRDGQPIHNILMLTITMFHVLCSKQLMVPGTYICPSGWTRGYNGWLLSESQYHKGRTMYTCVDNYPDL